MELELSHATSDTIQEERARKILNGIWNVISSNAYHQMEKCNKSDKGSKQEHELHPVICNGAINAKSPQVWTHFQRLKLST